MTAAASEQSVLSHRSAPTVVGVLVAVLVCGRLGPTPFRKVFNDDGRPFLSDFAAHGWRSIGYVYAGYLSVPSRALAGFGAAFFPLSWYALWSRAASVVVAGALAAFIFAAARPRCGWWALVPSLAMGLVPALRYESLGNLSNLQVFLIPAACWAMPEQRWSGPGVTLAAALASPLAVFALPLLVFRRAFRAAIMLIVGLVLDVIVIVIAPHSPVTFHRGTPPVRLWVDELRSSVQAAVGNPSLRHAETVLAVVAFAVVIALFARAASRPLEAVVFVATGAALAIATVGISGETPRYMVVPTILLVSGLVLLTVTRRMAFGALAFGLLLVVLSFPVAAFYRSGPDWNGDACAGRKVVSVGLSPAAAPAAVLICSGLRG